MAGWLHGVCAGECLFVFQLCGFSLSLFCNYYLHTLMAQTLFFRNGQMREYSLSVVGLL